MNIWEGNFPLFLSKVGWQEEVSSSSQQFSKTVNWFHLQQNQKFDQQISFWTFEGQDAAGDDKSTKAWINKLVKCLLKCLWNVDFGAVYGIINLALYFFKVI